MKAKSIMMWKIGFSPQAKSLGWFSFYVHYFSHFFCHFIRVFYFVAFSGLCAQ